MTVSNAKIMRVLEAIETQNLAKLAKISSAHRALSNEILALQSERNRTTLLLQESISAPSWEKVDIWIQWCNREIREKSLEMTNIAAEMEAQKFTTTKSIGRKNAFSKALGSK